MEEFLRQAFDPGNFGNSGTPPASKTAIASLPDVEISELQVKRGEQCTVCTEFYKVGEDCKKMPCKHIFHDMCLVPWLNRHNSCPTCRFELPTLDHDYEMRKYEQKLRAREENDYHPVSRPSNYSSMFG